jgi:hypothetical protein
VLDELEIGDGGGAAKVEDVVARAAVPRRSSLTPTGVGLAVFDGDAFAELRATCGRRSALPEAVLK